MIKIVKLSKIYFTQDSLDYNLSDKPSHIKLQNLFQQLKDGTITVHELTEQTPLNVYKIQKLYAPNSHDVYYSCNNRKLCVLKDYEKYLKNLSYLTKDFGISITVKINPPTNQLHQLRAD